MVADEITNGKIKVIFYFTEDIERLGYAGTLFMDLDVEKIESIGWKPSIGIRQMFERMLRGIDDYVE